MGEQAQNDVAGSGKPKGEDVPQVVLLDDKPTNEDKTGDGHQRVADAIARLIEREKGGKAIALEGSWGSGKSSVIEMLGGSFDALSEEARKHNEKLARDSQDAVDPEKILPTDYMVYVFDAWKHEGDPLLLAFLQDLVATLSREDRRNDQKAWLTEEQRTHREGQLEELSTGTGSTQTINAAQLRKQDLVVASGVLVIPIALLLGVRLMLADTPLEWPWWIGVAMLVLVFVIALFPLRHWASAPKDFKEAERNRKAGLIGEPDAIQTLLFRQPISIVSSFTGPPPVTSLRFEEEFKAIVGEALEVDPKRKLVIVVDNLDRLSSEEALRVWTTMRVFLEMERKRTPWLDRFWLIVPYDRTALTEIWDGDSAAGNGAAQRTRAKQEEPGGGTPQKIRHSRPASFLDKTFAIRFDVPPLLLANWERALGGYLRDAFGKELPGDTIKSIARLSRRFASEQHHPPTPRHLKLFVNDIGALVRQHGSTFPLETLAAYAILRRAPLSPEGIREDLRSEHTDITRLLGPEWLDEDRSITLACLIFNTHDVELARELLLVEPIGRAIGAADSKTLATLLSNPAAESVLEDSVDGILEAIGRDDASNVEHGFNVIDAISKTAHGTIAEALKVIAHRLYPQNNVLRHAKNAPQLCRQVARLAANPVTLARVVEHLHEIAQDQPHQVSSEDLAKCWSMLWSEGGEAVRTDPGFSKISLPTNAGRATHFLLGIRHAAGADARLWQRLHCPEQLDLTKAIIPAEPSDPWEEEQLDVLRVVSYMNRSAIDWQRVADAMHATISVSESDDVEIAAELLRFMRGFDPGDRMLNTMRAAYAASSESPFVKHRASLRNDGRFVDLFATALAAERWEEAADFLVEHGLSNVITSDTASSYLLSSLREHASAFFENPEEHPAILDSIAAIDPHWLKPFLQQQLKEKESAPFAAQVMNRMEPDAIRACFHHAWVIRNWALLSKADTAAPGVIKNILVAHEAPDIEQPYAISRKLVADQKLNEQVGPIRAIVEHDAGEPAFYEALEELLAALQSDFWAEDIARKGAWYKLLLALREKRDITLGTNYYRGLEVLATQLVQAPEEVQKIDAETSTQLLSIVGQTHELTLAKALRDIATRAHKDKKAMLYEIFGQLIREAMLVDPQPLDVPRIVTPAVNGSHGEEPAWVSTFLEDERAPNVVRAADDADRISLLATIEEEAKGEGDDGGPYTLFLERCREAGLVDSKESSNDDDSPPA